MQMIWSNPAVYHVQTAGWDDNRFSTSYLRVWWQRERYNEHATETCTDP